MSYQQGDEDENERLFAFQRLLDGSQHASDPVVDLPTLRRLCERGIPNHPPHLRPLAYSLLLETLPPEKRLWRPTLRSQRERYYNLVKTFMDELESQPSSSSSPHDELILDISKDLKSLKSSFWRKRTNPTRSSPFRPIQSSDPDDQPSHPRQVRDVEDEDEDEEVLSSEYQQPILSRRALFKRIDLLNQIQHKGGFGNSGSSTQQDAQDKRGNNTEAKEEEVEEEIMSPKITLSIDSTPSAPILSRLDPIKPTPLDTSSASSLQPNAIAVDPSETSGGKPNSPITLLSPKPLPNNSTSPSLAGYSGSLYHPETNLESLTRLIYIFVRSNQQLEYQVNFVDLISTFYLIHAVGGGSSRSLDYIEENTFWFISSFFNEVDQCITTTEGVLEKLANRLNWINKPLYDILIRERNLDLKLFAYRWFNGLFLQDLPLGQIPRLMDFIMAEKLASPNEQPKIDLMVDIGLAMVLLVKDLLLEKPKSKSGGRRNVGLWESQIEDEDEDENVLFLRSLKILREYPIRYVGGIGGILEMTSQLRRARLDAVKNGENIDIPPPISHPPSKVDKPSAGGMKASSSWSKALGSFWGSSTTSKAPYTPEKRNDNTAEPSQPQPLNQNQPSHSLISTRERSDTLDSTTSSIQERLSALTTATPPAHLRSSSSSSSSLPRPLLLSSSLSTRRSSNASASGRLSMHRRDSSSSVSVITNSSSPVSSSKRNSYESLTNGTLSPPPHLRSPPALGNGIGIGAAPGSPNGHGLYRIGSRQRSRSSLGDGSRSPQKVNVVQRDLKYGEHHTPNGEGDAEDQESRATTPRPFSLPVSRSRSRSNSGDEGGNGVDQET
ncbi:hypothetical protein I302_103377 [Kwoniella bestiolae CBS 10118]|uniref:Rab-GAP TBC domain-containing protein n=1 Tax=Kwoniella bestiolae CBS 10118 TaxID=1296100 RepID=A0A1B9G885_9TREE|nr:hypothetical protein I302_02078 [Kwoniella bestiolae CBS 10118]OCF27238.1 hypothetical protein I302_02078 [Kwoniella bestiolae CBS 10118]